MKRRKFIASSLMLAGGSLVAGVYSVKGMNILSPEIQQDIYSNFKNPESKYHPFVRWWWNGNRIQKKELTRELHLLKEAGIGGVEINPIEFPHRIEGDDLGIPSLRWLSDEWIEMLQHTFSEAKKLDIGCDLIVGSGWPFGSETLRPDERAEVILLNVDHIEGPCLFERKREDIFKAIDPKVTVPCPDRSFEILSLNLVPDPIGSPDEAIELTDKYGSDLIKVDVPDGKYALYSLVRVQSFANVINGAPGASGPILNHMDRDAVRAYLNRMSDSIERKTGPLSKHLRAFFSDSMELEGCNWTSDLPEEFLKRRGYDINPYMPFILFKVGRLGGVIDDKYGVKKTKAFEDETNRVRFDFEFTKAELLYERFTKTYLEWCAEKNIKSRAQAYGRGFFPLETSLCYDFPEGESWTTNWLKHKVGEEMPDDDYRRGRAYTMINKYVSSAAHLTGKRVVSCEEMTNTYLVFNTSLERLKNGSDQSIISGITHSVWHGFNYSPPEAPYPGWIQYGSYLNEQNNWWPFFKYLNAYKARISALLQNTDMYTDIAILPANYDLWSTMGVQTDPFPEKLNVPYTSLLWEAISKTGGSADYISEIIIQKSTVEDDKICIGPKKYGTIFLPGVNSINPETLKILHDFVSGGGRVFCIDSYPDKAPGFFNYKERDKKVRQIVDKLRSYKNNFVLLPLPEDNRFLEWYGELKERWSLPSYLKIEEPDRFLMQARYSGEDNSEYLVLTNSHIENPYSGSISIDKIITKGKFAWVWDPETGERYRISNNKIKPFDLRLGPAQLIILVFDKNEAGKEWQPIPSMRQKEKYIDSPWILEFKHSRNKPYEALKLDKLSDLSLFNEYSDFSGQIVYKTTFESIEDLPKFIELQKVHDIAELYINGINCGVKWYGERIFNIEGMLKSGRNEIEIRVTTLMGNYMKSLKDNPIAQYWTNEKRKSQELTPIGLAGPVVLFT